ncbi:PREDICTED: LOW QUALITY PROTEIN: centrosomal protein of 295 kDa [Chinchilla lanigera]|uniref:LOW QUALITY PROTEIN: centrosomal protein of 295 kDa n=1 Tax=Chinchilla lanigera TaxID=34839 RepID=UPI0006968271|nr:PREDICTED: LOW QUALITY PROTEIN: centrosomal protein of 295 kDa [Chinchilla lanigera]
MKRKVVNAGKLRLSPNEEAFVLREDYERRRKLRLLQVREQEKDIALQIREDIKQRRTQQFARLAEELRAEWEESQTQKIQNLEKLYLASLKSMGEGHRQAKENEPNLDALARQTAERKRKAEMRHKEALKVQKNQKEILMRQKNWHIKARKEALLVEKERSAKITSLPPPAPAPFENIEVKRVSSVKTSSSTYHHISAFVSRQMETKQPDAHLAAEDEAKRLEELQKQAAQERLEQLEKAHARGFQAMKKIHLAQNQEKLMKELKQLQQEDLARRKLTVAQMPPQLVELPYKRSEMKEDWQRELEFAFEDMYNADRKVKGNLVLHLEPEPLPTVTDQMQDEELDLSVDQENIGEAENLPLTEAEIRSSETDDPLSIKTQEVPSKVLFKRLLNKIRNQKSLWTIKSVSEDESEMITTVSETESKARTIESGTITSEEGMLSTEQEQVMESDILTIESGPFTSEDEPLSCGKEQEINETLPVTAVPQSSVLLHPQEEAVRVRMSARQKQIMEIEEQKQKQLELLEQIEQQKLRLETDCFRAQLEEERRKRAQRTAVGTTSVSFPVFSDEDSHRQMIHNYQQQLLQQNRLHKQSVEIARRRLLEYQVMLKERYPSTSATSLIPDSIIAVPTQESEKSTAASQDWDPSQRFKLTLNKYQPIHISKLKQDCIHVPRQSQSPQIETKETSSTSDLLAKQSLESQKHLGPFSQIETQKGDYKLIPKGLHVFSSALSHDRQLLLQDTQETSETLRPTTSQAVDAYQVVAEDSENVSLKLTEPAFLPLVPEHSFTILPSKVESEKIQEPFSAMNKSAVSVSHAVVSQMRGRPFPSSDTIIAQQDNLKALQEQLELQKEVLQARREAQEQFLLCKQKELEEQTGLSIFFPVVASDSFVSLPSAKADCGRIQEPSPTRNSPSVFSGHPVVPHLQGSLLSFSQPILSQQNKFKFLQEPLKIQRDNQARREAQEVLFVHKQSEVDGRLCSEQAEPSSLPYQVAQHTFTFPDRKSEQIQEQHLSSSEKGLLSSGAEIPKSQDGSSDFLQQFLPHGNLKLLQEEVTPQRDTLPARCDTQVKLLSHGQRGVEDNLPGQISSSSLQMVIQHSDTSQTSANVEPKRFPRSSEENIIPFSHLVILPFQDKSLNFSQHSLPQQDNLTALQEQSHIQRVILDARQESQEFVCKQSELEKRISSEQTGTSSSLPQVADSERFQEFMSVTSDVKGSFRHSKSTTLQERLSHHILPQQDNLKELQEKEVLHLSQKTPENTSSEQTGLSSFEPQVRQLLFASLRSVGSSTSQEPQSTESDSKIPSSRFQIPELQDRLLKMSQLIQPQQDNLKALQEKLATQREAIIQSRQEAEEKILLLKQNGWKGRKSEQASISSPLGAQHSFASLAPTESDQTQELWPADSDNTISGHCEIQRLPDRLLNLSHPVLLQQNNLIALQEHMHTQTNSFPSTEKTQKELILPRQYKCEEKIPSEHFIQSHHGDLKALQQQLDTQRKAIRYGQKVQEELLLQRLNQLEQRVSSEQISSSSLPSQIALPAAYSETVGKIFLTKGDDGETQASQTAQLELDGEMVHSTEKCQEELLLNKQSKLGESESAEYAISSLFLSKEAEHSFIPLPFAEAKPQSICELYLSENEHAATSSDSVIPRFQDRLLSCSQPVLVQQDNAGLCEQLDLQREFLQYSQKAQAELLVQRRTALQQHTQKHQETLKGFITDSQASKLTVQNDFFKMQTVEQLREWPPHVEDLARGDPGSICHADKSNSDDHQLLLEDVSSKQSSEPLHKEPGRRASKPPVAKVKCGLDLIQHELSAIQEVESPASGRTSVPGKPEFSQDRDPLRVSVSREQSFLGSPQPSDPFGGLLPTPQEQACGDDYDDEAVKVKESDVENHAVLSYAAEEAEHTCLGQAVRPDDKAETQDISHEPLSPITVSTGSFLSYDNTDLSLMDPVDFDFPELEHIFPNLHRQLFKPLEPHPDFDLSSSSSGVSQDNRDFYQSSDCSSETPYADVSSRSTVSFTALRRTSLHSFNISLTQQPDPNVANAIAQSFATETVEGSEQSFQQLLPEFPSQEGNQHADLPSIFSIEARDAFQGMKNENHPSEQTDILQNKKKSVHFQLSVGNFSSACSSSDETNTYEQLHVQHSTPCGSTSSESLIKHQLPVESKEERLSFEDLSERETVTMLQSQGLSEDDKNETCRVLAINPHVEETDSELCVRTVEMGTSDQTPQSLSTQNEKYFEKSVEPPEIIKNLSQPALAEPFLSCGSFSLRNSIPFWETESGHGIMEEPELTLVSTSDISIAETDFANLTLEEKTENETQSGFQVSEFVPAVSETETSVYPFVSELSMEKSTLSTAVPESLQEAFAKRKKSFMERSYQRQKEVWSKTRVSERSQFKTVKEKSSIGSSLSSLKGTSKVRVCLPEERRMEQALIHKRSTRLYNQLSEIKQQKEEKAKQEAYVLRQNRARAKEFHKKTLEKLRAKSMC